MVRALAFAVFVWFVTMVVSALVAGTLELDLALVRVLILVPPIVLAGLTFRAVRRSQAAEDALQMSAVVTPSGLRLVAAAGDSPATAIVCLERNPAAIPLAEHEFAQTRIFTEPGRRWALETQTLRLEGGRALDVLVFRSDDGGQRAIYFDVSRSALFS